MTKERLKSFFSKRNIILSAVILLLLVQFFQIQSVLGTFSFLQGRDSSFITEIGQVKEGYGKIANDLNEVRDFLRMPKSSYAGFEKADETPEADQNKNQVQLALFKYIDFLGSQRVLQDKIETNKLYLENFIKVENSKKALANIGLKISQLSEDDSNITLKILGPENETLFFYYLSKEDGKLFVRTVNEKKELLAENAAEFASVTIDTIEEEKESLIQKVKELSAKQKTIDEAIKSKATQDAIAKLSIKLDGKFAEKDLKITYLIFNKTEELIGEIVLDTKTLEISLVDKNDEFEGTRKASLIVTDVASALPPFLEKLDTKTFIEKKSDQALKDLENTVKDDGFKLLLSQVGLRVAEEPRVDDDRIFYDILNKQDKVISSLAVEKTTGVINIVEPDGTNSQNLLFFQGEAKKKTLEIPEDIPDYSNTIFGGKDDFNVLIAGEHSGLVDTMIFAHIDEEKREIRMVSVPRDLFYNGRKINAFAVYYGMPELKKVLSEISGYQLDKYIKIDMYAFIDVIDIIGGIDIHLNSAVIDPTYRTVDNGKEGTLHYEPGDYHLGGKEALRLARTRHTSSDFARAERQQKILEALQNKARNFGFGDADTIYQIAKTVLSKTETDIGLDEALAYYFRYQNYKIVSNDVMSSGNVLYVPPYITTEDCQKMIETAAAAGQSKPGCENENHAYTLSPLNNNWNVIKWFFQQKFEGEKV